MGVQHEADNGPLNSRIRLVLHGKHVLSAPGRGPFARRPGRLS